MRPLFTSCIKSPRVSPIALHSDYAVPTRTRAYTNLTNFVEHRRVELCKVPTTCLLYSGLSGSSCRQPGTQHPSFFGSGLLLAPHILRLALHEPSWSARKQLTKWT